jgi:hypothetical protein
MARQQVSEHTTNPVARTATGMRASTAHRVAIVVARRMQIGQARAAVRAQLAGSLRQRKEISFALVRLRRGLLEFRSEVRSTLRQIGLQAARKRSGQKVPTSNAVASD